MFDRRLLQNFDWILLFLLFLIGILSVMNLYSATYPIRDAGGSQILLKQIYWFLIGFTVLGVFTTFDYHVLERIAYSIYIFSIILLILVFVIGVEVNGSRRWIKLFGIAFQPSEFAKIAIVIVLAKYFTDHGDIKDHRLVDLIRPFILIAIPCALIFEEPDLGSAVILAIISFSVILFMKIKWSSLLILVITCLLLTYPLWLSMKEYQQKRILILLRPEMEPRGAGYHIIQSKIAVGSGLLWGKGFLKGTQTRLHFLPEQHTDFVFSVLAEEWGLIGAFFLLTVYFLLIMRAINIAKNSKDRFGTIIAIGVGAIIFWQLVINISMTIGLLPVVGIPLVMFSYGGSSIVTAMAGMGLLMSISIRRYMFQ